MTHLILPKSNISGLEMRSFWSSDKDTWNTVSYSLLSVPITVQNSTFPCYLSGKAAGKGCGSKGTKAFLLKTSPAFSRASKIQFSLDITKDLVFFISVSPFSHGNVQYNKLDSIMNPKLHMFKSASFLFAVWEEVPSLSELSPKHK